MCIQVKKNAVESALHDCLFEEQPGSEYVVSFTSSSGPARGISVLSHFLSLTGR